jgi:hypothetical protein
MIQATGTITKQDGVTTFVNPLLNVSHNNSCYGKPQTLAAQVVVMTTVGEQTFAQPIIYGEILMCLYNVNNPTFEGAQLFLKEQLEKAFPTVTFKIV